MENYTNLNATSNESSITVLVSQLPIGAVAFAPFLLLELVAAVASNAILLALVILACVKKLNNNINIYLFSLAVGGLIGAFSIFCILTLVVARRWVLGFSICNITYYMLNIYNIFFIFIYLLISRDKLKGVKDPLHGRPTNKRAYINSVLVWVASSCAGAIIYLAWIWSITQDRSVDFGNFFCFGITSVRINDRDRFIRGSFYVISFWIVSSIIIVITITNFVRILLELHELKKYRMRFANSESIQTSNMVIRINGYDKPLNHRGEERTAKSLILVYFIQFTCVFISFLMYYIQTIRNFALPPEKGDGPDFQIYFVVMLIVNFFPCINPIFLILSNKRLRTRVKELFKCNLTPEVEASPVHRQTNQPRPKKTESTHTLLGLKKTNKIIPSAKN